MAYLVLAAQQLQTEVLEAAPKAKITQPEEVDGFGFQRSIRVEGEAGKRLADALDAVGQSDERIAEVVKSSHGVRVTMVPDPRADQSTPFGLSEALAVLDED